jgi:ribonuclease HI
MTHTQPDIIMYTDGGARGNPGPAGAGAYITDKDGHVVAEISAYFGERTNNWAEYQAIILGLEKLHALYGEALSGMSLVIHMDSELAQRQLSGIYKVKHPDLKRQYEKVRTLLDAFVHVDIVHVRREYNKEADRLANEAMDRKY